jgi:hypothetical protein
MIFRTPQAGSDSKNPEDFRILHGHTPKNTELRTCGREISRKNTELCEFGAAILPGVGMRNRALGRCGLAALKRERLAYHRFHHASFRRWQLAFVGCIVHSVAWFAGIELRQGVFLLVGVEPGGFTYDCAQVFSIDLGAAAQ